MSDQKSFPLQPARRGYPGAAAPLSISWSVAEKAYGAYASRYGRGQSLERLAERGGFGVEEMDKLYPPWREEVCEIIALRKQLAERLPSPDDLTFARFSKINRERCESKEGFNHKLDSWSESDWMTALVGEVGEAANVVKKLNRVRDGITGNKATEAELRAQLRQELGDVFVYLDLMAQALGFHIADAAVEVFNAKSEALGCPIKMTEGRSPAAFSVQQCQP